MSPEDAQKLKERIRNRLVLAKTLLGVAIGRQLTAEECIRAQVNIDQAIRIFENAIDSQCE